MLEIYLFSILLLLFTLPLSTFPLTKIHDSSSPAIIKPSARLSLPWKTRIMTYVISIVTDKIRRSNGTVNRRLLRFLEIKVPSCSVPYHGVKSSDVVVDRSRNIWFRMFTPVVGASEGKLPVIVFFHGGGFSFLSADTVSYDLACRKFASQVPAIVVSVNYRLSPEYAFPSQYDDGFDTLKFLDDNSHVLPEEIADLSRCFLAGDSAGANLAHHVAVRAACTHSSIKKLKVQGLISIQPFFGGQERTESEIRLEGSPIISMERCDWMWKVFLPKGSDRDHEAANVSGKNAIDISTVSKFPRTIVFIGGFDPLQDWQKRYYQWLKRSRKQVRLVEYANAIHGFHVFPESPESSLMFKQVKEFINFT